MITDLNSSYDINGNAHIKAAAFCGMSTDVKPINVGNGSTLHEIDTGKRFMFDASGKEWYEQASEGGGSGGATITTITFEATMDDEDKITALTPDCSIDEAMSAAQAGPVFMKFGGSTSVATYEPDGQSFEWTWVYEYNSVVEFIGCFWESATEEVLFTVYQVNSDSKYSNPD